MPSLILWKNKRINRLREDMDRIFDRMCGEFGTKLTPRIAGSVPFIDLTETDDNLILVAEIPGVSSKDLEVDIVEDMLTIRGEKKQEEVDKLQNAYHKNCKTCHKKLVKENKSKNAPYKKCTDCHQKKS